MLPYIPSKKLKIFGLSLSGISLLLLVGIFTVYRYSGEVIATAHLTKPLSTVPITLQALEAQSQAKLQNTMNKIGVASVRTDTVETIDVTFQPVQLSKDVGEIALLLNVDERGIYQSDVGNWQKMFGNQNYTLTDMSSGEVVFQHKDKYQKFNGSDDNGVYAVIDHTKKAAGTTQVVVGGRNLVIGRFTPPKDGDYQLHATFEKLKYSTPVSDLKLVVKTGMMQQPSMVLILSLFGLIFFGLFIHVITTPPELRKATQKNKKRSLIT